MKAETSQTQSRDAWRAARESAAEVMAHLLRNVDERRAYFEALAAAIDAANAVSDSCWSVSLFADAIRLNVGQVEVITLSENDVYLVLDPATIPAGLPKSLRDVLVQTKAYTSVPGGKVLVDLEGKDAARWYRLLKRAHEAMATRAAQAKKGTPHRQAYSEGVLLEAERALGRSLPRPSFASRTGRFVVLIATKEDVGLLRNAVARNNGVEWIVPKTSRPGDEAAIFLPGTGAVATAAVGSEPALGAGFGKSERRWRADVIGVKMLPKPVPIEAIRTALPEWKWPLYPKSLTTVPVSFEEALRNILAQGERDGDSIPEQAGTDEVFTEGATTSVRVNAFETSAKAKRLCVEYYGCKCFTCGFEFHDTYGPAGAGLIHVHHLVPLATIRREYQVNPVKDLRPVCPNCHALIHRRTPPYSPAEVKAMLRKA